jgi:hypothetical protein
MMERIPMFRVQGIDYVGLAVKDVHKSLNGIGKC